MCLTGAFRREMLQPASQQYITTVDLHAMHLLLVHLSMSCDNASSSYMLFGSLPTMQWCQQPFWIRWWCHRQYDLHLLMFCDGIWEHRLTEIPYMILVANAYTWNTRARMCVNIGTTAVQNHELECLEKCLVFLWYCNDIAIFSSGLFGAVETGISITEACSIWEKVFLRWTLCFE